jgi:hypothetical protein
MSLIPEQLRDYELLKIYSPDADCNHPGKQPIGSTKTGPFYTADDPELVDHIKSGGNVGLPLNGPLVVFDVDDPEFGELLGRQLPPTFSVRTGSGGEHRYYHCPEWSDNRQFTVAESDYGSIRAEGWQVVIPPSVHPETSERYQVQSDRLITSVGPESIQSVVEKAANTAGAGGGGGDRGGGTGGGSVGWSDSEIPENYPNQKATWSELKVWLQRNGFLTEFDRTTCNDWSGLEFKLAKCLAEGGFSEGSISDALDRLHHNAKWHNRGSDYRTETVRTAIQSAVDDPYVEFSTPGDMDGNTSESRKTESGTEGTGPKGGENMTEFTEQEEVKVKEGDSDGDRAIQAVRVEGKDGADEFEFISVRKGRVRTVELTDGSEGQMIDVDETNGKSVGGTADLDLVIEALTELRDELN